MDVEPSFLGVGPYHLMAGMNNRAWIYSLTEDSAVYVRDREYLGTITSVHVNSDYASVLYEGKIQFHLVSFIFVYYRYSEYELFSLLYIGK